MSGLVDMALSRIVPLVVAVTFVVSATLSTPAAAEEKPWPTRSSVGIRTI